jgi:ribosomal protein L37AE/L43A
MRDVFAISFSGGCRFSMQAAGQPTNIDPPPEASEEVTSAAREGRAKANEAKARSRAFDDALMSGVCPHCASHVVQRSRFFRDDIFQCSGCGRLMETILAFANKSMGD